MRGVRVMILACASVAAMAAMWLVRGAMESNANAPARIAVAEPVQQMPQAPQTVDILVASQDIPLGRTLTEQDVKWQPFPVGSISPYFYSRQDDANALATVIGNTARAQIRVGEPLSTEKIVGLKGAGVMSSLLRKGMRAVAVPISDITGAGGFILPGDFVDLLLTRQITIEEFNPATGLIDRSAVHNQTDTVMSTVRVLAIDQRLSDDTDAGETSAIGNTATIELLPEQVELIALTRQLAKQERGFLTLALRSFAELAEEYDEDVDKIMPETVLDLQAMARAKVERAQQMRELAEQFQAEQREMERQRILGSQNAAASNDTNVATGAALTPQRNTQNDDVVLVRNGTPIIVKTTSGPNAEGASQ